MSFKYYLIKNIVAGKLNCLKAIIPKNIAKSQQIYYTADMIRQKETKRPATPSTTTSLSTVLFVSLLSFTLIQQNIAGYIQDTHLEPHGVVAGAASLSAEVPATPTNTLYERLQEQQTDLDRRDKELTAKERYLNSIAQPTPTAIRTLYILLAGIFCLVAINFYFDIRRRHAQPAL